MKKLIVKRFACLFAYGISEDAAQSSWVDLMGSEGWTGLEEAARPSVDGGYPVRL